ncbi:hypothetical protein ACI78Q_12025 [Geodermatophilus sp. SYSU D00705]
MAQPRIPRSTYLVLGALTAFGPLATDLYLPGLPDMAGALDTTPSLAQATMATCLGASPSDSWSPARSATGWGAAARCWSGWRSSC